MLDVNVALVAFWASALLLLYTYLGYPLLIRAWAAIFPRPVRCEIRRDDAPTVSIILSAHNEEMRIDRRLKNLLALDYPVERVEIFIGSDGSTDRTVERARGVEAGGIQVVEFSARRGKPAVLNTLAERARGDILVFADARQRFHSNALWGLVAPFADPQVGAVSGELVLIQETETSAVGRGIDFYWRYEKCIRRNESRIDSLVSVTGAIYAVRRALFEPIPDDAVWDDGVVPLRIALRGYRVVFASDAIAYDRPPRTAKEEFNRKVRSIAGTVQTFVHEPRLIHPLRNRLWLQVVSHKALRLFTPFFLAAVFVSNVGLADDPSFRMILAAQIAFYATALVGYAAHRVGRTFLLFSVPCTICVLGFATLIAIFRSMTGRQPVTWEKAGMERV